MVVQQAAISSKAAATIQESLNLDSTDIWAKFGKEVKKGMNGCQQQIESISIYTFFLPSCTSLEAGKGARRKNKRAVVCVRSHLASIFGPQSR